MSDRSSEVVKKTQGFLKSDIQRFLQRGSRLASASGLLSGAVPALQTREERRTADVNLLGQEVRGSVQETVSGPELSEFSGISKQEVTRLIDIFKKREADILGRRRAPGRAQTRLLGAV